MQSAEAAFRASPEILYRSPLLVEFTDGDVKRRRDRDMIRQDGSLKSSHQEEEQDRNTFWSICQGYGKKRNIVPVASVCRAVVRVDLTQSKHLTY